MTIKNNSDSLLILYDDRTIQFDQDFNVVKNELSDREIRYCNQQTQQIQQHSLEQNRSQQIQQDIDLSL